MLDVAPLSNDHTEEEKTSGTYLISVIHLLSSIWNLSS